MNLKYGGGWLLTFNTGLQDELWELGKVLCISNVGDGDHLLRKPSSMESLLRSPGTLCGIESDIHMALTVLIYPTVYHCAKSRALTHHILFNILFKIRLSLTVK